VRMIRSVDSVVLLVALLLPLPFTARAEVMGAEVVAPDAGIAHETVVVVAKPLARDRTQDETLVGGQTLRESPRASTFEALAQESAGMYVPAHGALHGVGNGATGGVHLRGLGGSPNAQVLVVEDGVPDFQGIFGHPIPDAYTPSLIDDVLVIKGGDSVLFGTNAMGGVVAIRSRWRHLEGYEVSNDAAGGSYATVRERASLLARLGPLDLSAGVQVMSTEGHRMGAGGNELIASTAARYRLTSELKLTARNKIVHLSGGDPGPQTHPYLDHTFDAWRDSASMQLAWSHENLRLSLTPYLNVGIHRLYDGFHSTDLVGGGIADLELKLHPTTELLLGVAAEHLNGDVENRVTGERSLVKGLTDAALYHQLTFRPVESLSLVVGARELYSSRYGLVVLYKGGVRWNLVEGLSVRTRVVRNFRQPTIRELYLPFPTANPELKPEYALNWDFGATYVSEHLEVSCSGYRTEAENLIKYFGVWPSAEVVNIDRVVIWGLEGRVGVRGLGPVSVSVTGDWQDVGRYTRQNPDTKINFSVDASQEFGAHFVGGALSGEWVHGLYMADYARQRIPDVFVIDLALRYRYTPASRGLTLEPYLLLRNLLDRRYAYVEGYSMPGFNVLVGLKIGI